MSIRHLILNNFWQKIFSLVLAMLIWFAIDSTLKRDRPFPAIQLRDLKTQDPRRPVIIMTSPTNRLSFTVDPLEVDVTMSGDRDQINDLDPEQVQAYVKLTDVTDPNGLFPVEVSHPPDFTLERVWPTHVLVEPTRSDPAPLLPPRN